MSAIRVCCPSTTVYSEPVSHLRDPFTLLSTHTLLLGVKVQKRLEHDADVPTVLAIR